MTSTRRDLTIVVSATLLALLPFVAKPLHVDDPMYVWAARQIAAHPLDPYGFRANWDGRSDPMVRVMQNPPLVPYYQAAAASVLGWSEVGLHLAAMPVAVLAVVGTYLLAGRFCRRPVAAALVLVAAPGFLVPATTLMCEAPLLCLWVWAVYLWVRGSAATTGGAAWAWLLAAGTVAAAAPLAKYPGVNLIPLLAAHAVICPAGRRGNRWPQAVAVLLPVVVLLAYDRATAARYGYGLVGDAFGFSRSANGQNPVPAALRAVDALCFLGGGGLSVAVAAVAGFVRGGRPWTRSAVIVGGIGVMSVAAAATFPAPLGWASPGPYFAQAGVLAVGGVAVVAACVAGVGSVGDRRGGLFLLVWVAGVVVFATFLNWAVNVRSFLPLLPAACVLAVRATDGAAAVAWPLAFRVSTAVAAAFAVAVAVAVADERYAVDNRTAAVQLMRRLGPGGRPVWFGGHWGFQYYMERAGGRPLDDDHRDYRPGDWVVLPTDNYGTRPLADPIDVVDRAEFGPGSWLTTMSRTMGAGFHFSPGNRLPFVFGPVPPEAFLVARVRAAAPPSPSTGQSRAGPRRVPH